MKIYDNNNKHFNNSYFLLKQNSHSYKKDVIFALCNANLCLKSYMHKIKMLNAIINITKLNFSKIL